MSEGIETKIQKLLALAKHNSNRHEAQRALERAHQLAKKYGVTMSDVSETVYTFPGPKSATWIIRLAKAVADRNGVSITTYSFREKGNNAYISACGPVEAIGKTRNTIERLVQEITELTKNGAGEAKPNDLNRGEGKAFASEFRAGCVEAVISRIQDEIPDEIQSEPTMSRIDQIRETAFKAGNEAGRTLALEDE